MADSQGLTLPYQGDFMKGVVSTVISTTQFTVNALKGYGDGFFQDWDCYVARDSAGAGAAPQGDKVPISAYTSATGLFTASRAFDTAPLAVGDTVILMHPFYGENTNIINVPSNDLKQSDDTQLTSNAAVLTQIKQLAWTGTVGGARISFDMRVDPLGGTASAVVYKNGVPVVVNPALTPNYTTHTELTGIYQTFTQDVYGLTVGDLLQLYVMASAGATTYVRNFRISYDILYLPSVQATIESVYYDQANGVAGTDWPIGTVEMPSNNYTDTMAIAAMRNMRKVTILGGGTFVISTDFTMALQGSPYCSVIVADGLNVNILSDLEAFALINNAGLTNGVLNIFGANEETNTATNNGVMNVYGSWHNIGAFVNTGSVTVSSLVCDATCNLTGANMLQVNGNCFVAGAFTNEACDTDIFGDAILGDDLTIAAGGDVNIRGILRITGDLTHNGTGFVCLELQCGGNVVTDGTTFDVRGKAIITGTLTINDPVVFTIYSDLQAADMDFNSTNAANIYGGLKVIAGGMFNTVGAWVTIQGDVAVDGTLTTDNTSLLTIGGNCKATTISNSGTFVCQSNVEGTIYNLANATWTVWGTVYSNDEIDTGSDWYSGAVRCQEFTAWVDSPDEVIITGDLTINGSTGGYGDFNFAAGDGNVLIHGNLLIHGDPTGFGTGRLQLGAGTLMVAGRTKANVIVLTGAGTADFFGAVDVARDFTGLTGTITIYGDVHIGGDITATTGDISIYGDIQVHELTTISGNGGSLTVRGDALLVGNVGATNAGATITVSGLARIYGTITATGTITYKGVHPETAVNINATNAGETNFLDYTATTGWHYRIEKVRLKCADPGANTVTVRLYELVNAVLTEVDSFAITTANFATYFSLMDMFGLDHLSGDDLTITVRASAGGPYAVTGSYSWRTEEY